MQIFLGMMSVALGVLVILSSEFLGEVPFCLGIFVSIQTLREIVDLFIWKKKSQLVFFTQCFGGYVWMKYCSLYLWFYCKYTSRAFRFIERKNMRTYFSKSIIYLTF